MSVKVNPRFPDYEIHSNGKVFRFKHSGSGRGHNRGPIGEVSGRVQKGYRGFKLCTEDSGKVYIRANRLIAETFIGPCPSPQYQCAHNDGNKLNNHVENLRWATAKENTSDKEVHGTMLRGEKIGNARLSHDEVREIIETFKGHRGDLIAHARKYKVGTTTILNLVRGITYRSALDQRESRA
jgi:hypothetical protein